MVRPSKGFILAAVLAAGAATGVTTSAKKATDLGREVLSPNDGWASLGSSTTGGSLATDDQIYRVTDRKELVAALNNGIYPPPSSSPSNAPKIIYVSGTIDANVDDGNQPLTCEDYYRNGFTLGAFLETYDPAVWGRVAPTGPLELARVASRDAQQARVRIRVGSNTTIVGLGEDATIRGAWLDIRGTAGVPASRTNIIVRNITFEDTYDCFPQWSTADGTLPQYFGVLFQVHDGLVDITNASDLATVSWNRFENHDKLMLIGSSDSATADRGKLRVTLHHNLFEGVGQRAPRVRFGQVHVYNNLYRICNVETYQYSWGVGIESQIHAENNFFDLDESIALDQVIERLNGTAMFESGTLVNGKSHRSEVSLLEVYNAANDPDIQDAAPPAGWTPTLFLEIDPTKTVPNIARKSAGPFDK